MTKKYFLLSSLLIIIVSCSDSDDRQALIPPLEALVVVGADAPEGMRITANRFVSLLAQAWGAPVSLVEGNADEIPPRAVILALGPGPITDSIIDPSEREALPEESYCLRKGSVQGHPVFAAAGADLLGNQYAAYALLSEFGFGFFHPEDTFIPANIDLPEELNRLDTPSYPWRGFHLHTMHPMDLMDALLVPSSQGREEAMRYMDWLIANRCDYFQWVLLATVDMDGWIPHARAIADHAHLMGLRIGIDVTYQFRQQNGYLLIPEEADWVRQLHAGIDRILEVPFDVINVEMGTSEFTPTSDILTVEWLNETVAYLERAYASQGREVELLVKVHCSTDQTAPNYGDINFNFLPGLADPRVGVMPHTVQFYDLYRPAPTYGNEDFSHIRAFLLEEIGERRVIYYPETSYWVSFDIDVPLFLPHYIYSRWNDLYRLRDSGMDGQINFSSGFEWGYWLNDFTNALFSFHAGEDWKAALKPFTRIFGPVSDQVESLLVEVIEGQGQDLLGEGLIGYLIGYEVEDDLGQSLGILTQPGKIHFHEIDKWDESGIQAFEQKTLLRLEALAATYGDYTGRMSALLTQVPKPALRWFHEIDIALHLTRLRAEHVTALYKGVVARRRGELGLSSPPGGAEAFFLEALAVRKEAEDRIAQARLDYRYAPDRLDGLRENPTAYEFGYLYPTRICYFWLRDEAKAIHRTNCPCELNIVNLIDMYVGEGPLGEFVERLPPLSNHCLDQCIHPTPPM